MTTLTTKEAEFKKSFTQEQEDAIWQYMIDHSRVQPNGMLRIFFHVSNVDDLWRRVYARYSGDFSRYDKAEREVERKGASLFYFEGLSDYRQKITDSIDKEGTLIQQAMLWVHRWSREKLYGKTPSNLRELRVLMSSLTK